MGSHAKFSASASERWLACPGSIPLSVGAPNRKSDYAAEGTLAHRLFEAALLGVREPAAWLGEVHEVEGYVLTVDAEMVEAVERSAKDVRAVTDGYDFLAAESELPYGAWLAVDDSQAFGTTDCVALLGRHLQVHDFKYGKGVKVSPVENTQLMLYAGGALARYETVADIDFVRLFIHQPRVSDQPYEWSIAASELRAWLTGRARSGAASVLNAEHELAALGGTPTVEWEQTFLEAGDHCRWCPAKLECPKLREEALTAAFDQAPAHPDEFDAPMAGDVKVKPVQWLAALVPKLDMIEDWAKSLRAEALRLAEAGALPGYKAVAGRRGARAWADKAQAEELLRKQFRLKVEEAYDLSLISPTAAEKLAKAGVIGERQWKKAQALIVQPEGKPHLAPADDPRPALRAVIDQFDAAPAVDDIC